MTFNRLEPIEQYYSVAEVAKLLNVHEMTIRQLYASGKLRIQRIGKKTIRISGADLNDFLAASNRVNDGTSEPTARREGGLNDPT
jgi:excisionase family DNA binding protein